MNIEPLEPRIAPASAVVIYTDVDGDLVKITATVPGTATPPLDLGDLAFTDGNPDGQLATLTLTDVGFNNAKIVFTVTKKTGGDGLAHVGFIDVTGRDLDRVVVKGDLGRIVAGDSTTAGDPGLNLLQARSMGTLGLATQAGAGNLNSTVTGSLGELRIAGDVVDAFLNVVGPTAADAAIGTVSIGGDLVGGLEENSGRVASIGTITKATIGGSILGGEGGGTGQLYTLSDILSVRIGGDLVGGAGIYSGQLAAVGELVDARIVGRVIGGGGQESGLVFNSLGIEKLVIGRGVIGGAGNFSGTIYSNGDIDSVAVNGDFVGGAGTTAGSIDCRGALTSVTVRGDLLGGVGTNSGLFFGQLGIFNVEISGDLRGGSGQGSGQIRSVSAGLGPIAIGGDLVGGAGDFTGLISTDRNAGPIRIGGDILGGSITGSASLNFSGAISAGVRIFGVSIGGSLIAGSDASTGTLANSGAIIAGRDLGPVMIGRDLLGDPTNPALIVSRGQVIVLDGSDDLALASVTVGRDVRWARILAGFDANQAPINADASIGAVKVGRNWAASVLVAGAADSGGDGFGRNDAVQAGGDPELHARIASIVIRGDATGSARSGDHFGFVAQEIGRLQIGPRLFPLSAGPANDSFAIPHTADLRVLEV